MLPPREQLVVMHCDLVEFSRLTSQNEDATFHAVKKGFEQAALLVSDHGGTMVNTAGDSLLAVFRERWLPHRQRSVCSSISH